jgi:hypothetical protein
VKVWGKFSLFDRLIDNVLGLDPCGAPEGLVWDHRAGPGKKSRDDADFFRVGAPKPALAGRSGAIVPLFVEGGKDVLLLGDQPVGPGSAVHRGEAISRFGRLLLRGFRHGAKLVDTPREGFDTRGEVPVVHEFDRVVEVVGIYAAGPGIKG